MTGHVLAQRALVRMLYDPRFRQAVLADPAGVLGELGVPPSLVASFAAHDPRAFAADPYRAHRALAAVMREAPVSLVALARLGVPVTDHLGFFSRERFHRCVMGRGVLALAFLDDLEDRRAERARRAQSRSERASAEVAAAMISLERAIAEVRRPRVFAAPPGTLVAGRVAARLLPSGALAAWERTSRTLGAAPVDALLADRAQLGRAQAALFSDSALGRAREAVLVEHGQAGPVASFSGEALVGLVERAREPVQADALVAYIVAEGATETEAHELIAELVADGVLVEG